MKSREELEAEIAAMKEQERKREEFWLPVRWIVGVSIVSLIIERLTGCVFG